MAERVLKCDDLTYLEDLPIFSEKVNFKIHNEEYVTKESYQEYEYKDHEIKINKSDCFGNNITDTIVKLDDMSCGVISYKTEGPAIFSYNKPITRSTRTILNREAKSIGYKISTNEIMNATRVVKHMFFDKITDEPIMLTKEFFKSDEKGKEDAPLNSITTIHFTDDPAPDGLKAGIEEFTMFDKDGNIEEYTKSENLYGLTITGEWITLNVDYKYTSCDDYKENIIPQYSELEDGKIEVSYIKKSRPYDQIAVERFIVNNENLLVPIYLKSEFGETFIDEIDTVYGMFPYTTKYTIDDKSYSVTGMVNYPLSGDLFSYNKYKEVLSMSKLSYFDNIYESDNGLECFYNQNRITNAYFEKDNDDEVGDKFKARYSYHYDDYGVINIINMESIKGIDQVCNYKESKLPNGNKIIESCIPAEPLFPMDKKSIFYRAVEIGKKDGTEYIASDYRALVVMQKDYKD